MAIKRVVIKTCDRCKRDEEMVETTATGTATPVFDLNYHGRRMTYTDICPRCKKRLDGLMKALDVVEKKKKSDE